jgi:hypothetical protein
MIRLILTIHSLSLCNALRIMMTLKTNLLLRNNKNYHISKA